MKNIFTPQVQREINSIRERQEINQIINKTFEPKEKRMFNVLLICIALTPVAIPTLIFYL